MCAVYRRIPDTARGGNVLSVRGRRVQGAGEDPAAVADSYRNIIILAENRAWSDCRYGEAPVRMCVTKAAHSARGRASIF